MGWTITRLDSQSVWSNDGEEFTTICKQRFSYQENDEIYLEIEITHARMSEDESRCDEPDFRNNVLMERTAKIKACGVGITNVFNVKLVDQKLPMLEEADQKQKGVNMWEKEYACVSEPQKFKALLNAMHQFSSLDNEEILDLIESYFIPTGVSGQGIVEEIWLDDIPMNLEGQREFRQFVMQNFIEDIKPRVPSLYALCQATMFPTNNNNNNHNNSNNNDLSEDLHQDKKRKFE